MTQRLIFVSRILCSSLPGRHCRAPAHQLRRVGPRQGGRQDRPRSHDLHGDLLPGQCEGEDQWVIGSRQTIFLLKAKKRR